MKLLATVAAITASLLAMPLSADNSTEPWSDEAIWVTVSKTHGLHRRLRAAVFRIEAVRVQIRRVGVARACDAIAGYMDRKESEASDTFRSLIVTEVRKEVPIGDTLGKKISVTPSGHRFSRIIRAVEGQAPQLFASLYSSVTMELVPELEAMATIDGEWREPVPNWNFDAPNQTVWSSSCLVAQSKTPREVKRAFDGFYKKRD